MIRSQTYLARHAARARRQGVAPLALIGCGVYCVFDPEADDAIALEAAYRVARVLALATLREASVQLDVPAVQDALADIVRQVGEVQGMKSRLTSIGNAAGAVSESLDDMRRGVLRAVTDIETQLQVIADATPVEVQSA